MPPYELRLSGKRHAVFDTEQQAMEAASAAIRADADARVEVLDQATGQAAAPAASQAEQESMAKKVGF